MHSDAATEMGLSMNRLLVSDRLLSEKDGLLRRIVSAPGERFPTATTGPECRSRLETAPMLAGGKQRLP